MAVVKKRIGVLALQGDVQEHVATTNAVLASLRLPGEIVEVRDKETAQNLAALIIPGGESTVLEKLTKDALIFSQLKKIKNIFGTCAGAIFLAKKIDHAAAGQKTLEMVHIVASRNAYGRQADSFETDVVTTLGPVRAVFIRAPQIQKIGPNVRILAKFQKEIIAAEEQIGKKYYLVTSFHPELTTTVFHEYFLKKVYQI